jgi:hypothetical protein
MGRQPCRMRHTCKSNSFIEHLGKLGPYVNALVTIIAKLLPS